MNKKTTFEEARDRGASRGFELLETVYVDSMTPMRWRHLECGHEWSTKMANITAGRGCPACAGRARLTFDMVAKRAAAVGFELLALVGPSSARRAQLRCGARHEWDSRADAVGRRGCPQCSLPRRKPAERRVSHVPVDEATSSFDAKS